MKRGFLFAFFLFGLASCTKETFVPTMEYSIANARSSGGINVEITTSSGAILQLTAQEIEVFNSTGSNFTATVLVNDQSYQYTVTSIKASSNNNKMQIVTNGDSSPTVFENKNTVTIVLSGSQLSFSINSGSISVLSNYGVIEEMDGI